MNKLQTILAAIIIVFICLPAQITPIPTGEPLHPGFFGDEAGHPWYEFGQVSDGSILLSYNDLDGKITLRRNARGGAGGRFDWVKIAQLPYSTGGFGGAPISGLNDGSLALTLSNGFGPTLSALGWMRAPSGTVAFADFKPITIPAGDYHYGPVIQVASGEFAFNSYKQVAGQPYISRFHWSAEGMTWGKSENIPYPGDGNKGITEATLGELPTGGYLIAIRSDEETGDASKQDGGYVAVKTSDGISTPVNLGKRIRMPRWYKRQDGAFILTYREYLPSAANQIAAVRVYDGSELGDQTTVLTGANNAPFVYQHSGEWFALVQHYPDELMFSRVSIAPP